MFRLALVLGLMSAIGPFAIDMYLPAMPRLAADLQVSEAEAQATLSVYFLIFGIAQLIYGPMADAVGRRWPMIVGIAIFLIASVAAVFAPDLGTLVAARAVQALGAAALMVVPRAVIRDLSTGPEAARMMAAIMIVIAVSPMLAPLAGSAIMLVGSWRWIFGAMAVAAVVSLYLAVAVLPETLDPASRRPVSIGQMLAGSRRLLTDRQFLGLTFIGGFGMSSFFVFLSQASFVYTGQFGLSPTQFSLAFAVNALGFFAASQFAGWVSARLGMERAIALAITAFTLVALALLAVVLIGPVTLPRIMIGLFLANVFLGLVMPTTAVAALDPHPDIAGLASSLGGTLQLLTGAGMIALTSALLPSTAVAMVAAVAFCAVCAATVAVLTLPRPRVGLGARRA